MQIGVVYPQTEFGDDPIAIRDYAQTAEGLGYTHVLAYDHVLGADPDRPGGWQGPYTHESAFFEPFLLFSYMAAITDSLGFVSGIIILPQRQTVLVAKQAATLDVLCRGRFRLGVGIGWNKVEYVALNENFHTRGKRIEAQVRLMQRLWTEPLVSVDDEWHTIEDAGLKPMPVQRPVPVWFGGHAEPVMRRIAQMGNGWLPNYGTVAMAQESLGYLDRHLDAAGRSRSEIGIEPRLHYADGTPDKWHNVMADWQQEGATHFSLNTMGAGLKSASDHIDAIRAFAESMEIGRG